MDHIQITCTSLQADNHASTSTLNFFTGHTLVLTPNQQCQSTEGNDDLHKSEICLPQVKLSKG